MSYQEFLESKLSINSNFGFDISESDINDKLFDFQKYIVKFALKKGRCAIFADCGLGKTPIQLEWANQVVKKTNGNVLILTPLAVSHQTIKEGEKFGIECNRSNDGKIKSKITITNYEKLHYFNQSDFIGVVCDESSILKSFDGSIKKEITEFMRRIPYRLLATATAAPNDYIELGTSSECLGNMGFMDMLTKYFKNDQNNCGMKRHFGEMPKWRFKGHSEIPFWRWITSWSLACRRPSDLGFDDDKFILPKLYENYHLVYTDKKPEGMLFNLPATRLPEQREERRRTIEERCEMVNSLVKNKKDSSIIWCHLNEEGNMLKDIISDSVQISGQDSDEKKESKFNDFIKGKIKVLITKPKIGAWGLNFQHCNHIVYFPSHSYEQYYQAVRRCWRFGQKREVTVDIVLTEGERRVMENMKRKSLLASKMFENLVNEMNNSISFKNVDIFTQKEMIPLWV